jgi:hypothetical protein
MHRSSRQRVISVTILVGGLALLAIGIAVAVARHNRSVDKTNEGLAALQAKYAKALAAADQPPRFEVSFVKFPLSDLAVLTTGGTERRHYEIVPTEVAARIRAGGQQLHPDFGSLPTGFDFGAAFVQAYREHRVQPEEIFVAALLVTQTTPGKLTELRLNTARVPVTSLWDIYDLTDVTAAAPKASEPRRTQIVSWRPSPTGAGALVPLCLLHTFRIPDTPANREILERGVWDHWQLASVAMLVPRRLSAHLPNGNKLEVDIRRALESPLDLDIGR